MKRYPLLAFFVLALALSWSIGVPLACARAGVWKVNLPYSLHYLTAYGPMLAALIVLGATEGRRGIGAFLRRGFRLDIGWGWLAAALLSPIALYALGVGTAAVAGRHVPGLRELGQINFLPNLGLGAWLLWVLTSGLGEEIGWRGYALPRLQRRHSALVASLILTLPWAAWHLPAFFYLPNYGALGVMLPGFVLGVFAGAIVYTWLYNSTRGSILAAVLFHGSFNFVTASRAGQGLVAAVASSLVIVWAVVVLIVFKPASLSRQERHMALPEEREAGLSRKSAPRPIGMLRGPGA